MKKNRKVLALLLALMMALILMPTAVSAVDPVELELAKYETEVTLEFDSDRGNDADVTDLVLVLKEGQTANPAVGVTGAEIKWDEPQNSLDMGGFLLAANGTSVTAPKPNWTGVGDDIETPAVNEMLYATVQFSFTDSGSTQYLFVRVYIEPVPASTVLKEINEATTVSQVVDILDQEGQRNNFGAGRDYVKYWYDVDATSAVFTSAEKTAVATAVFNSDNRYTLHPDGKTALITAYEDACKQVFVDRINTVLNGNTSNLVMELTGATDVVTGKTSVMVPVDAMSALLAAAQDVEDEEKEAVIEIKAPAPVDCQTVEFTVPRSSFHQVVTETNAGVKVKSGEIGSITFDNAAAATIDKAGDEGDIAIAIAKVDGEDLSAEAQELVGDRPVYDFTVTVGSSVISVFGDGSAKISLSYTLQAGEDANAIVVYYLNDADELEMVQGVYNAETEMVNFTVSHFSEYVLGYNKISFVDVASETWYFNAVTFIAARGITLGTDATHYSPNDPITRGQFIVMLMRAYGIAPDENPTDNFSDAGNTYYTNYLATAKRLGISNGVGDNQFAPEQKITRQDLFTLLYRTLGILGALPEETVEKELSDFSDAGQISDYASDALEVLVKAGVIEGSGGKLMPKATATRAEMAQVFFNLLSLE